MIKKLLIAAVVLSACGTAGSGDSPGGDDIVPNATGPSTESTTRVDSGTIPADDSSAASSDTAVAADEESTPAEADGEQADDGSVDQQSAQSTSTTRQHQDPPGETVPDETANPLTGEVPADVMASVYTAAEADSGLDRSAMTVVRAESVTWPDGSLGCSEPGMTYTMATVDGYWVELSAGNSTLDYRVGSKNVVKLCEDGLGITPPDSDS